MPDIGKCKGRLSLLNWMCRGYNLNTGLSSRLTSILNPSMDAQIEQLGLFIPSFTAISLIFLVCTMLFTKNGTQP